MKKLIVVVVLALGLPGVAQGQVDILLGILSVAPNVGSLANPDSVDAGRGIVTLAAPMKDEDFVGGIKTIAQELGYQVAAVGTPGGKLSVLLVKQSVDVGAALFGKDWQMQVNLSLEKDGRAIEIMTRLKGNDVKSSGTAQEAVEELKKKLEKNPPVAG